MKNTKTVFYYLNTYNYSENNDDAMIELNKLIRQLLDEQETLEINSVENTQELHESYGGVRTLEILSRKLSGTMRIPVGVVALVLNKGETKILARGVSYCSFKDSFNKKLGRKLARNRAMGIFLQKEKSNGKMVKRIDFHLLNNSVRSFLKKTMSKENLDLQCIVNPKPTPFEETLLRRKDDKL